MVLGFIGHFSIDTTRYVDMFWNSRCFVGETGEELDFKWERCNFANVYV